MSIIIDTALKLHNAALAAGATSTHNNVFNRLTEASLPAVITDVTAIDWEDTDYMTIPIGIEFDLFVLTDARADVDTAREQAFTILKAVRQAVKTKGSRTEYFETVCDDGTATVGAKTTLQIEL